MVWGKSSYATINRMNSLFCRRLPPGLILLAGLFLGACQVLSAPPTLADPAILYQDDFSQPTSQWDEYAGPSGAAGYADGAYRIRVDEPQSDYWANPQGLSFDDVQIEVQATRHAGSRNNVFGVLCRYRDENNFYQFLVSSDGFYDISKIQDGQRQPLSGAQLLPSESIPQEDDTLQLRAACREESLALWVNGVEIARAQDDTFHSGNIGLIAGAFDEAGVEIRFDQLVVRKP